MDQQNPSMEEGARDLVREANHRIANQLTLLSGMIQLQIDGLKKGPDHLPREYAGELLRNAAARIVAIGNLHRHLASSPDLLVELGPFLASTRMEVLASLSCEDSVRVIENLSADCSVSRDQASVLSLVMSEVIVNALKYGRRPGQPVTIHLSAVRVDDHIVVEIGDDGNGLPDGFDESVHGRVGFRLIRNLLHKIGARLEILSGPQGLRFRISLSPAQA